jgi:hypothetical protein
MRTLIMEEEKEIKKKMKMMNMEEEVIKLIALINNILSIK